MSKKIFLYVFLGAIIFLFGGLTNYIITQNQKTLEGEKVTFVMDKTAKTPFFIASLHDFCIKNNLMDKYGGIRIHDKKQFLDGYFLLEKAGIFERIKHFTPSANNEFSDKNYVDGLFVLRVLLECGKAGVIYKLKNNQFKEADELVDILSLVVLDYPRGSFVGLEGLRYISCRDMIIDKIKRNKNN